MLKNAIGICLAIVLMSAGPLAADEHDDHAHPAPSHASAGCTDGIDAEMPLGDAAKTPSSLAFAEANNTMHKDMAIKFTGNADVDFVRGMIPHHEGAIAMAKVQLEHGKDPEIRKLAEAVIAAQTAEIADMKEWLKAHAR
ncbi:CopM family metallochaperone [Rhizobium panacihumi]|uniref:CopM family metallochaperone n=1 Tax=Rhizobium panacihumi TaxID=2008450 RepID=UPI003D79ED0C